MPTLTFIGPANAVVEAGTTYVDQGATATDVVGGNLSSSADIASIDTGVPSTYSVAITAVNSAGIVITVYRT